MTADLHERAVLQSLVPAIDAATFGLTPDALTGHLVNAERLLADSMFLAVDGRLDSARSLAILGYEEVGKLVLRGWDAEGLRVEALAQRGDHLRKQLATATVLMSEWFRAQVEVSERPKSNDPALAFFVEAIRGSFTDSQPFRTLTDAFEGALELEKQQGFYFDVFAPEHRSANAMPPDVARVITQARDAAEALRDPRVIHGAHKIAAALPPLRASMRRTPGAPIAR